MFSTSTQNSNLFYLNGHTMRLLSPSDSKGKCMRANKHNPIT